MWISKVVILYQYQRHPWELPGCLVVKDSMLSLLWLRFYPWPENFYVLWVYPKKKRNPFFSPLFLLGLHLQHMEVPRLGVKSELQLLAYATATAIPDPRHICNLHTAHSNTGSFNALSKARDPTQVLMDTS